MKPIFASFGSRPSAGRPPVVELTPDDLKTIRANYIKTNRNRKEGSIQLAWVRFCESRPDLGHLVKDHMPSTCIPSQVIEACRQTKALVGPHRGGERRLRHESAYVPGRMRRSKTEDRRLFAGEQASVDDATRNVACYIPWPWGGCPCSDKFGVRLGRWQTLIVHDDATSYIPFVSSVFRWAQTYRATDAASLIYRAERDVLKWSCWCIEGGVWQAKRTLAVLAGRFHSAKGRPNQKLVENYIGRLWNVMAGQDGDVGRHQAEMKRNSELYVAARAGRVDPRKHFMSLDAAQTALYSAIEWLSEKRIDSATYGKWVPKSRWESDLEKHPRQTRSDASDHLILPVSEVRKVRSGSVRLTEDGPMGVPMVWQFSADWLWQHEGREVRCYFDPLAEWPIEAVITLPDRPEPLGTAFCMNPIDASKGDQAIQMANAIRRTMMTETRILSTHRTERTVRHSGGILHSVSDPSAPAAKPIVQPLPVAPDRTRKTMPETVPSRDFRAPVAAPPRVTNNDLANTLSRRLARLRGEELETQPQP